MYLNKKALYFSEEGFFKVIKIILKKYQIELNQQTLELC
jgi:hypothetical protein